MKTYRLTTLALLALLPIACSKDGDGRLRIYAEEMYGSHNTKVWVNPSDVSASASWVVGEQIDLNGTSYPIANDGDGNYLDAEENALSESLYAIYPATVNTDGNNITVTNNGASASTVVINSLSVNFRDGGHDIIFPMATGQTDKSSGKLLFKHLTGGLTLTLANTTASDCTVRSVKVVVYGDGAAPTPITAHNVTTRWAAQGPVLPGGEIGANDGNQTVGYASEMHFALKDNSADGKTITSGSSISFVIPVTITPIKRLVVTGYGTDGAQLFTKDKILPSAQTIQANYMYNIPEITF